MSKQPVKCKLDTEDECLNYDEMIGCGPSCDFYNPIDDSVSSDLEKKIEEAEKEIPAIRLMFSDLPKFDKNFEFVVLKKHVFKFQSVSPKKIILKYKRRLKDTDGLQDGCYIFRGKDNELLDPVKTFNRLDNQANEKNASTEEY